MLKAQSAAASAVTSRWIQRVPSAADGDSCEERVLRSTSTMRRVYGGSATIVSRIMLVTC